MANIGVRKTVIGLLTGRLKIVCRIELYSVGNFEFEKGLTPFPSLLFFVGTSLGRLRCLISISIVSSILTPATILLACSSTVEHSAVNRMVVGSKPTMPANFT